MASKIGGEGRFRRLSCSWRSSSRVRKSDRSRLLSYRMSLPNVSPSLASASSARPRRTSSGFAHIQLAEPPAMRWVVGDRAISGSAASASQMGRFERKWLSRPENLAALADLPGQWLDKVHRRRPPKTIVLDMDSSESPTYGEQEGSAYNGHFGCTCYHPLFVFNQLGDVERCTLRSGNVHSADGWRGVLEPVVARYRSTVKRRYFRGDAAFANPEIYEFLEAEGMGYAIRLPANRVLQDKIGYLLKRPVGRPPHEVRRYFASFTYQA